MTTTDQTPAAASVPAGPAPDRRGRVADAILAATYPPEEWPDGPPGEGEMDTAREQADAALTALPELAQLDQLRTALADLAAEWDARAGRYLAWRDHWHETGDETTARICRVRADMCTRHADRLRALLETL